MDWTDDELDELREGGYGELETLLDALLERGDEDDRAKRSRARRGENGGGSS